MSRPSPLNLNFIRRFIRVDALVGVLLIISTLVALFLANSQYHNWYQELIQTPLHLGFNEWTLSKPLLLWVNDGLMAVFFLQVGLELKREMLEGQLSKLSQIILPAFGALGGIIVPAIIYILFNHHDQIAMKGWAIPTATDIAFALGILSLLGSRVPISLKIFLMSIAIYDDLAAIIIIAVFYTSNLSTLSLLLAAMAIIVLMICNILNFSRISLYCFIGLILWTLVLKSGVHATLAGVILGMTIPLRIPGSSRSPLKELEHGLYGWVSFLIIPLFAFVNSGLDFEFIKHEDLYSPLTLGIALGLFLGKQLGIFSFTYIVVKMKFATLPPKTNWAQIYGVSILGGIGFTMSLFISTLAFEHDLKNIDSSRLGIFIGTLASAVIGFLLLRIAKKEG